MFLMYRVELKFCMDIVGVATEGPPVPNVPCGVEIFLSSSVQITDKQSVPNVPCGVERGRKPLTLVAPLSIFSS